MEDMAMGRWAVAGLGVWVAAVALGAPGVLGAAAQGTTPVRTSTAPGTATTLIEPPIPLLASVLGGVERAGGARVGTDAQCAAAGATGAPGSADAADCSHADRALVAALAEDGLTRWSAATYQVGHGTPMFALQFHNATGAYAAFTTLAQPHYSVRPFALSSGPGSGLLIASPTACAGACASYVLAQSVVLSTALPRDSDELHRMVAALPKVSGSQSLPPLLPTYLPAKNLEPGSLRYAIGPLGYRASGMAAGAAGAIQVDPAALGFDRQAEAVQARYAVPHGAETLTLLLYPTPQVAGTYLRAIQAAAAAGTTPAIRREGELVLVAAGALPPPLAQKLVDGIHLRQEATMEKALPPSFHGEVRKTASLFQSIAILFGVLASAAVLMALFLGGGRAVVRKLQGKSAATEAEFLSLHLDPQNAPPVITRTSPSAAAEETEP